MSKSPLRRLTEQFALTTMRPPVTPQLRLYGPTANPVDLKGKRILLTGASSGIGESAAEKFARRGATVVAVARRKELLDAVVGRIEDDGGSAIAIPCNLSDRTPSTPWSPMSNTVSAAWTFWSTTPAAPSAGRWPSRWNAGTTSSGPWFSTTMLRCG